VFLQVIHEGTWPFEHVVASEGFEPSKLSRWTLQTSGGEPLTSRNVSPPSNFRAHSPQIVGHPLQPDTPARSSRSLLRATTTSQTPQTPTITLEIASQA
jgi:hypothetical protein